MCPSACRAKQVLHTRFLLVDDSSLTLCELQLPHTSEPHMRQWCRRRVSDQTCGRHGAIVKGGWRGRAGRKNGRLVCACMRSSSNPIHRDTRSHWTEDSTSGGLARMGGRPDGRSVHQHCSREGACARPHTPQASPCRKSCMSWRCCWAASRCRTSPTCADRTPPRSKNGAGPT